jgi:HPt (histidine-containing phosphotransfer) domain-containing protein
MTPAAVVNEPLYSILASDPDMVELVEPFVSEMPGRCDALRDLFTHANWADLKRAAHQLKGAAGGYGFDPLTPFAAQLENAITSGADSITIEIALEALVAQCGRVRAGADSQG